MIIKTPSLGLTGKEASELLHQAGLTCNKNMIPFDTQKPMVTSGVRLGTPAITSRGVGQEGIIQISEWIERVLKNPSDHTLNAQVKKEVHEFSSRLPLFHYH